MAGAPPSVPLGSAAPTAPAAATVPLPRRPLEAGGSCPCSHSCPYSCSYSCSWERARWWYENVLGWPTVPGAPVRLRVGVRFDVLDVPAEAGHAALERLGRSGPGLRRPGFPVAVRGGRMSLLVAAGSAEEMPGLLEWLEWGSLPLDLTAVGAGGLMEAPMAPGPGSTGLPPRPPGRDGLRGAAVWLRPPEPGCGGDASLPTLSAMGGAGTAPDLARLVHTLATQCHRIRLSPPSRATH
ncbi:SCO3374 family protein [Streptomyces sp. NPDC017890]|uniref:SCO3374 family protein n=1 Tax=Streptomyces sp. NPDC017890 TaxID=3365015 RepID=UPI0037A54524